MIALANLDVHGYAIHVISIIDFKWKKIGIKMQAKPFLQQFLAKGQLKQEYRNRENSNWSANNVTLSGKTNHLVTFFKSEFLLFISAHNGGSSV